MVYVRDIEEEEIFLNVSSIMLPADYTSHGVAGKIAPSVDMDFQP